MPRGIPKPPPDFTPPVLFNGQYVVTNTNSGESRTFRIATKRVWRMDLRCRVPYRVFQILTDKLNRTGKRTWRDIGTVTNRDGIVPRRPKDPELRDAAPWYARVVWELATEGSESVWHERGYRLELRKTCYLCNLWLSSEEGLRSGIGFRCRRKPEKWKRIRN